MTETRKTKAAHLLAMPAGILGGVSAQELRDLIESLHPHQVSTDPVATDDSDAGFDIGHTWRNTSDDGFFICADGTAGAAVWVEIGVGGGGSGGTVHDHRYLYEENDGAWKDVLDNPQGRTWGNPTTFRTMSQPRTLAPLNATTGFRNKFDTYEAPYGKPQALLVVNDVEESTAADSAVQTQLEELGFVVTTQNASVAAASSGYRVAVVSESIGSNSLDTGWDTSTLPVLCMEFLAMDTLRLVDADASVTVIASGTVLRILDDTHDAVGDLVNGLVTVYSATGTYAHVTKIGLPAGGTVVAEKSDDTTEAVVVVYDSGATLTTGTAPARRAVYGHGFAANQWSADGASLFDSLVYWLAGYEY